MRKAIRLITLTFFFGFLAISAGAQSTTIDALYSLNAAVDGSTPYSNLVQASDGNFYGTTSHDGVNGYGTIFRLTPNGEYTVLYAFQGGIGGQFAESGLYLASDGNFYGTTYLGGSYGAGMVYRVSMTGVFTPLYSFTGGTDGASPSAGVIEGSDGNFYGTTSSGGAINAAGFTGYGTIYQITPNGVLTTIYTFTGMDVDGAEPYAGLVEGSDGFLYGTTNNNEVGVSIYEGGSVFKVSKTGTYTNLHHFAFNEGINPDGGLVEGLDGSFYGTTHNGGLYRDDDDDSGQGTLYNVKPDGTLAAVYKFTGQADSGRPEGTLTFGSDGNLYGTTTNSPQSMLFQLTPAGGFVTLGQIGNNSDALAGPIVGSDGNFYGTTAGGGANGIGQIYHADLSPALSPLVQVTLSSPMVVVGTPVTLNWQVANAFSNTTQRCVASMPNGTTAGSAWTGVQTGSLSGTVYSGSTQITPTAAGTYTYALTCGGSISGSATLTVPVLAAKTTSLPDGVVSESYSQTLMEQNGLAPFNWTITSGSLPDGLALNASTGAITGTPTRPGVSSFTARVTDSESVPVMASTSLSITIAASSPTVSLGETSLNVSTPGATVTTTLAVSGFASNAFSFTCSGLPAKSQCIFGAVVGTQAYGTTTLQVVTDGGLSAHVDSSVKRPGAGMNGLIMAAVIPGLMGLFGFSRKRRKVMLSWLSMMLFAFVMASGLLTGCGSSSKPTATTTSTSTTPTGTSTVTVTATAGDQTATTNFTLQVQ